MDNSTNHTLGLRFARRLSGRQLATIVKRTGLGLVCLLLVGEMANLVVAGECGCWTCRHRAAANWFCAPQSTTGSLEVNEWGVETDFICPAHSGLFGSACHCPSACGYAGCDAGGGPGCEATCDAACDAGCTAGLAGLDAGCELDCECAADGQHLHARLRGIGPRMRKRLMRKTLVYSLPSLQYAARPCPTVDCGVTIPSPFDSTPIVEPARELPPPDDDYAPVSASSWISRPVSPVTMLLSQMVVTPAPVVTAAASTQAPRDANIYWVGRHNIEPTEHADRMESAIEIQPTAPLSSTPTAASADVWPIVSPTRSNQR